MATGFKTGGRAKGSPNQVTKVTRKLLQSILEAELKSGRVQKELKKLDGRDYLYFLLKLSSLLLPRPLAVDPDLEEAMEYIPPPLVVVPASLDERTANKHVQELEDKYKELVERYFPEEETMDPQEEIPP